MHIVPQRAPLWTSSGLMRDHWSQALASQVKVVSKLKQTLGFDWTVSYVTYFFSKLTEPSRNLLSLRGLLVLINLGTLGCCGWNHNCNTAVKQFSHPHGLHTHTHTHAVSYYLQVSRAGKVCKVAAWQPNKPARDDAIRLSSTLELLPINQMEGHQFWVSKGFLRRRVT